MVLDTRWRYEFDMLWIWDYDFDMGFVTILIRFGYDFDTVLIWFQWVGFKQRNRNSPGTGFWSSFKVFLWFRYDFDMVLIRFWYDFDTFLIWFWYGSSELASKKRTETAQGQVFGRFFAGFCGFDLILIRFWYGFDTIFEYFLDMVPMGWLQITSLTHIRKHKWNHIKIITAKPSHKQIITTNHIWNVSKSKNKIFILETSDLISLGHQIKSGLSWHGES